MPLYNSLCTKCNQVHEYTKRIADRDDTPICCNQKTIRVILKAPLGTMVDDKPWLAKKYKHMY